MLPQQRGFVIHQPGMPCEQCISKSQSSATHVLPQGGLIATAWHPYAKTRKLSDKYGLLRAKGTGLEA